MEDRSCSLEVFQGHIIPACNMIRCVMGIRVHGKEWLWLVNDVSRSYIRHKSPDNGREISYFVLDLPVIRHWKWKMVTQV